MQKCLLLTAVLLLFAGVFTAEAACTVEDVQIRHQDFMNTAVVFAQTDPDRYKEVALAMQTQLPELLKLNDLDKLCSFYEEWTRKMQ